MCVCSPDPWCWAVYIAKLARSSQGKKGKFIIFGFKKKKKESKTSVTLMASFFIFFFKWEEHNFPFICPS